MKINHLITLLLVIALSACTGDLPLTNTNLELPDPEPGNTEVLTVLKSATAETASACDAVWYPLFHKKRQLGFMVATNSESHLTLRFLALQNHSIASVQVWAGTDLATLPTSRSGQVIPGKFPIKGGGADELVFQIHESEVAPEYQILSAQPALVVAHVEIDDLLSGKKESVWAGDQSINDKSNAAFATYYPCIPTHSGGCYPHIAFAGQVLNAGVFLDAGGGQQDIYTDDGEKIGTVRCENGGIIFNLNADWYLNDEGQAPVTVFGYSTLYDEGTEIPAGIPLPRLSEWYFSVPEFPWYQVELNVQICGRNP